jgi:hypothetical protein
MGRFLLMILLAGVVQGGSGDGGSQTGKPLRERVLDILAAPIPLDSTLATLPGSYGAWTEDQRRTVPRQIEGRCAVLWTMMNAGGKIRMLPPAEDAGDTAKLVSEVCVVGKMPRDWPGRAPAVADLQRIAKRAAELGDPIALPKAVLP